MESIKDAKITRVSASIKSGYSEIPIRVYEYNKQIGCAVSTATSLVVPLSLQNWFKKTDFEKQTKHVKKASKQGSDLHTLPEKQAKGEDVVVSADQQQWFEDWNKTQKQYDISAEMNEVMVFSKIFAFGGQIDRVGMFNGKRCIIDFKTGRYSHMNLWKTEAYRQAYIEMTGDEGVGAVVLHLPRPDLAKKGMKVSHYTIQRHETCFLSFLCAYQTFKMYYYKELLNLGMAEKDVFASSPYMLYEREYGFGSNKGGK